MTVWALDAADSLFNGRARQGPESREAPQDRGPTQMSPNSNGDPGCAFPAQVARAAHLQRVIERVRPHLEVLLTTLGAAALHVFAGACLELVVMADIRTGVVVAILFAMRNFPEGVVFARDIIMISSAGEWGSPGRWPRHCRRALFAGTFVGLCDCLGASMALGVTKSIGKHLYFVTGGFIVGLGILKHLRAAVACDPEQKLPAIAFMLGMVISGIMLIIIDDIAAMSAAR